MVEVEQLPAKEPDKSRRPARRRMIIASIFVLVLLALAAAWIACAWFLRLRDPATPQDFTQMQQRLSIVEHQLETINGRLNDLDARTDKIAESDGSREPASPSASALVHMQSDMVTLSSAVGTLQAELKQAGNVAAHIQQTAQSSLAAAIAFIQLREAAEAGRGFTSELAGLRSAAKSDGGFQEPAAKLEPYAAKGVPTVATLREEFIALESPALVAIDKAAAQNWRERLLAELKGLISIRPLHGGGASDAFTATEDALAAGDLEAALAATGNLPARAQDTLKDWRAKAEARATVEAAVHTLSDHFIALAVPGSAPNTQDEP